MQILEEKETQEYCKGECMAKGYLEIGIGGVVDQTGTVIALNGGPPTQYCNLVLQRKVDNCSKSADSIFFTIKK